MGRTEHMLTVSVIPHICFLVRCEVKTCLGGGEDDGIISGV